MRGFLHLQVSHDPEQKINLPKGTTFGGVKIKSCLHKEYPQAGDYAGGIIFRRCYGMGEGIGFTRDECEEMWDGIDLGKHVQTVHGDHRDRGVETSITNVSDSRKVANGSGAPADPVTMKTGQCLEVYWDEDEKWYPCVVKDTATEDDVDSTIVSLCRYDDCEEHWHNLRDVVYKLIRPTEDRIKKVGVAAAWHTCKYTLIHIHPYTYTHTHEGWGGGHPH